jgi:sulfate adenylyltransferase subunit 2
MSRYQLDYLEHLESEAIHIFREVAGQFERPALLFSGGKDSITLVQLALKPSVPASSRFPWYTSTPAIIFPKRCSTATGWRKRLVKS